MDKRVFTGSGNAHFVTFGCAGRRRLLNTPASRQVVISLLGGLVEKGAVKVSGFVIMPDHVHALLWYPHGDQAHSRTVQTWKRLSSHYLIEHYRRINPQILDHLRVTRNGRELFAVWVRRFFDFNVDSEEKHAEKIDSIHGNPVKQGLCGSPEDWLWSSASWYLLGRSVGVRIDPGFKGKVGWWGEVAGR